MKEKRTRGILVGGLAAVILLAGCGGSGSTSYDLGSSAGGTGLTSSFDSPAEMGVGDIMPIEFPGDGEVVVDFTGVDTSSRFTLVVGNAKEGGAGTNIQLSTDMMVPMDDNMKALTSVDPMDEDEMSADEIISVWMRALEYDFAFNEVPPEEAVGLGKALATRADVTVGSIRDFRMLNSLSSSTSYVTVQGEAACIGNNIIVYVDTRVTDELSQSEVDELCGDFDLDIGEEEGIYGSLSDVDSNDKLIVFLSMQVNLLGSLGGGIITGYFYAGDLYPSGGSNPVSNNGEIIYTMVPDPTGRWGVPVTGQFALENLIPAVLVHEAQHAISYNQHVFVNGGSPEEPWLNEALSHFTEDIMGYGRENPSRIAMYLDNTATTGLVTSATPDLLERGASYLFIRFLYEQHLDPDSFLRAIQDTSFTGVENLENAYQDGDMQGFSQFMARWAIALAVTDKGITSDPRYIYQPRTKDPITGNWQGVCLECEAEDGRGTVLDGVQMAPYYGFHTVTLESSALKFFEIQTVPNQIVLEGSGDSGDFAVLIRSE